MNKKEGKGLKSFNKGFQVPDTYIIIFFVVVIAAVMTFLVPKGYYETEDVTYLMNGVEKTRTVIKDGSFQYLTDAAGKPVTEGVALFSGDGGTGFFNYMYNGIISSSAIEIIAFLMVVGGAFGIMIRTGAVEAGLIGLIRNGDTIHIDIPNRILEVELSEEEIEARRADYVKPEPKVKTGYLARYAKLVTSANTGAVLSLD